MGRTITIEVDVGGNVGLFLERPYVLKAVSGKIFAEISVSDTPKLTSVRFYDYSDEQLEEFKKSFGSLKQSKEVVRALEEFKDCLENTSAVFVTISKEFPSVDCEYLPEIKGVIVEIPESEEVEEED